MGAPARGGEEAGVGGAAGIGCLWEHARGGAALGTLGMIDYAHHRQACGFIL